MTKDEFNSELSDLMVKAIDAGLPPEDAAGCAVQTGYVLLAHLIGVPKAVAMIDELQRAMHQLEPARQGALREFLKGKTDGTA